MGKDRDDGTLVVHVRPGHVPWTWLERSVRMFVEGSDDINDVLRQLARCGTHMGEQLSKNLRSQEKGKLRHVRVTMTIEIDDETRGDPEEESEDDTVE